MEKDIPPNTNSPIKVMGLASNNVWIVGDRKAYTLKDMIINWNGTQWKQITKFYSSNGDINIYDAWTNG
jgi:hypothetical protein